jgi:hypothetical protein
MRPEMEAYRQACMEAKCDECRNSSVRLGWDEWCGGCIDRMPDYPRITDKMGKAASQLYAYLRLNSDRDVTIQECTAKFGISLSRAWQLVDQLHKRGLIEQDRDIVWAWDGEKPYMGGFIRD